MCAVEQVLGVSVQRRGQYSEVCVFATSLRKYNLRKCVLFVLCCARVRRVCPGVFSMCWCV